MFKLQTTTLAPIAAVTPQLGGSVLEQEGFRVGARWSGWDEEYERIAGKSF